MLLVLNLSQNKNIETLRHKGTESRSKHGIISSQCPRVLSATCSDILNKSFNYILVTRIAKEKKLTPQKHNTLLNTAFQVMIDFC